MDKRLFSNLKPLFCAVALLFLSACEERNEVAELQGQTMGTYWQIKIAQNISPAEKDNLQKKIEQRLIEINQSMSTYIPDSEISLLNQKQSIEALPLSSELAKVVKQALKICQETGGMYDVTVLPLVELWGFGAKKSFRAPSDEEIKAALKNVGCDKITLDGQNLSKHNPQISIDLSSIAKGYGVDEIAALLEKNNLQNYLVDIGGEVRANGKKYNDFWKLGIETPDGRKNVQQVLNLNSEIKAVATSGNYRNYIDYPSGKAVHTINAKTGLAVPSDLLSATVIAENTMLADGYATAMMALGSKEALNFAEKYNLAVLLIINEQNQVLVKKSSVWEKLVK